VANRICLVLPKFARACGRVPVGGDPDKRPVNRRNKGPAAGGEPANPAKRGTRLKATTDRAFSSLPASKPGLPKRLVFLAGRAEWDFPTPNEGHEHLKDRRGPPYPSGMSDGAASDRTSARHAPARERSRMAGQRKVASPQRGRQFRIAIHPEACWFWRGISVPFEGMPR
jgi:hypothetical protein